MTSATLTIAVLATAVWVGTIVFHSFVVAPTVFGSLDEHSARRFLRTLFPRFYRLGLICGLLMLVSVVVGAAAAGWPSALVWIGIAASLMTAAEALSLWITPRINAARDAGEAGAGRFDRLHRLSVGLTLFILLLGVAVLALLPGAMAGLAGA